MTVHDAGIGLAGRGILMLLRMGLGGVLIWAGLEKLQQPYDFLGSVYNYELVSPRTGYWVASMLPWLEVCVGVSLVLGIWQCGSALLSVGLFMIFTAAQASAAAQGLKIPCGCAAGSEPKLTSPWRVAESGVMLLATSVILVRSKHAVASRQPGQTGPTSCGDACG